MMFRTSVFADQPVDAALDIARMRGIGFLVYSDIEALDICGPLGAFAYADCYLRDAGPTSEPSYEVIAASAGLVRTQRGLRIAARSRLQPSHAASCNQVMQRLDTLIVVGGVGAEAARADPTLVDWLQAVAPGVRRPASVCTGAFLLSAAGLLNDRRVTMHWMFCDHLTEPHASLRIVPERHLRVGPRNTGRVFSQPSPNRRAHQTDLPLAAGARASAHRIA